MLDGPVTLAMGVIPARAAPFSSASCQRRAVSQSIWRPPGGEFDTGRRDVRPRRVSASCRLPQQRGGGRIIQRWGEPNVDIDGAQVWDHPVPFTTADGCDGQFRGQRELRSGRAGQRHLAQRPDQVCGLGDGAGAGPGRPGMPGDVVHVNAGAQDAPAPGDHMVRARHQARRGPRIMLLEYVQRAVHFRLVGRVGVRSSAAVRKPMCTGSSWNCTSVPQFCGGTARKAEISNWISDGTMETPTRTGRKENGPTASSAPSATASAPAPHAKLALRTGERGRGGTIVGDAGIRSTRAVPRLVRLLVPASGYNGSRSVTMLAGMDH